MFILCPLVPDLAGAVARSTSKRSGWFVPRYFFVFDRGIMSQSGIIVATSSPFLVCDFPTYSSIRHTLEISVSSFLRTPTPPLRGFPIDILTVLYLAVVNNSRISEVLDVRYSDYCGANRFLIRGKKRSYSYQALISCIERGTINQIRDSGNRHLFEIDYRRIWRWLCKSGIGELLPGRKTVARTHLHRYYTVQDLADRYGLETAQQLMHHKTTASTAIYNNRKGSLHGQN